MALDEKYDLQAIERKWQAKWCEADLYHAEIDPDKPKYYGLEMFPYPSGAGLSVGHFKNYAPNDAFLRYKSMRGFNVLHPMGWDAFGLPAENEAIKRGRNPREMVARLRRQLQAAAQPDRHGLRLGPGDQFQRPRLLQVDAVDLPAALQAGPGVPEGRARQLVSQ